MNLTTPHSHPLPTRVLIVAYACSPYKGSESIVGWGRALETAKYCETWVLAGTESEPDIKKFLSENGEIPNLHFCFLERNNATSLFDKLPSLYAHNYLAINNWHRRAKDFVANLHQQINFDLVHHVNITGYREPGYLWQLDIPFVWGPISGTQNLPWRFLPTLGLMQGAKEFLRNSLNVLQLRTSSRVRKAANKAAALITANSTNREDFVGISKNFPVLLLETGLAEVAATMPQKDTSHETLRILWSGEHKAFKALPILLDALASLSPDIKYELKILGRGPMRKAWEALAIKRGIKAEWLGFVPYTEIMGQYDWADVFVFTSLRDTSGNVMLEAISRGIPVICPNHQGAADIIDVNSGIKIPVNSPRQLISNFADAIEMLAEDRQLLARLSHGALERARYFLWENNGAQMAEIYRHALSVNQPATLTSGKLIEDAIHAQ